MSTATICDGCGGVVKSEHRPSVSHLRRNQDPQVDVCATCNSLLAAFAKGVDNADTHRVAHAVLACVYLTTRL